MSKSINKKTNKIFLILVTSNLKKWVILSYPILIMPNMKHNLININPNTSMNMMMINLKFHKLEDLKIVSHSMCHQKSQRICQEMISMLSTVLPHKKWEAQWYHKINKITKDLMLLVVWMSKKWVSPWCQTKKNQIMSLMHSTAWFNQRWMAPWCHKNRTRALIGLVMNKMTKNNQAIKWKKVKKTNNKDLAISRIMNLNTCQNLKFQPMNKK